MLFAYCQQSFKGQGGLRCHIVQIHSENGVYDVCASKVEEIKDLLTHMGNKHPNVIDNENEDLVVCVY